VASSGINAALSFQIVTPIALGIAAFSMNEKVLPFQDLSFKIFLGVTLGFIFVVQFTIWVCAKLLEWSIGKRKSIDGSEAPNGNLSHASPYNISDSIMSWLGRSRGISNSSSNSSTEM